MISFAQRKAVKRVPTIIESQDRMCAESAIENAKNTSSNLSKEPKQYGILYFHE